MKWRRCSLPVDGQSSQIWRTRFDRFVQTWQHETSQGKVGVILWPLIHIIFFKCSNIVEISRASATTRLPHTLATRKRNRVRTLIGWKSSYEYHQAPTPRAHHCFVFIVNCRTLSSVHVSSDLSNVYWQINRITKPPSEINSSDEFSRTK